MYLPELDIINDEVIISAKEYIYNILFVNCCLLVKIDTITEFYLAVCNINREIYVQTTGKIAVFKIFDYFNGEPDNLIPLSMNLIFNNYFNFCTLTVITEQFTYYGASETLRIKNIEVSTYPFDSEIYNYDKVCYGGGGGGEGGRGGEGCKGGGGGGKGGGGGGGSGGGSGGGGGEGGGGGGGGRGGSGSFIGSGGGLVNINKYDERSVIIIFTIFIYLKRAYYYSKLQFDNLNISRILSINVLDRYINIIYPLITSDNVNDIIKAIQIISNAFINVSNKSEFQSLRNTYKIFIELERSILLLKNQVSDINELYTVLLYLYTPEINYGYIITPENEEIINGNIYIEDDNQEKDFIITNINEIINPDLLEYIQIIDKIFIEQDSYEINAIINNVVSGSEGGDGGGDIHSKLKNIVSKGSGCGSSKGSGCGGGSKDSGSSKGIGGGSSKGIGGGSSKGSGGGSSKGSGVSNGGGSRGSGVSNGGSIKINSINKFSNKLNKDNNKKQNKMFNKIMGKDKSMHCKNKGMYYKNKGIYCKNKSNGDKYIDNSYEVYISSLLYSNGMVYVYDYLTNDITLLLYGNESNIDIYNNAYIDLIKIVLTSDILE
jgi:hypothetical protein